MQIIHELWDFLVWLGTKRYEEKEKKK